LFVQTRHELPQAFCGGQMCDRSPMPVDYQIPIDRPGGRDGGRIVMIRVLTCVMLLMFVGAMAGCEARARVDEPERDDRRVETRIERERDADLAAEGEIRTD
jgi:hypothetical protein